MTYLDYQKTPKEIKKINKEFDNIIKNKITKKQLIKWFLKFMENGITSRSKTEYDWTTQVKDRELKNLEKITKNN